DHLAAQARREARLGRRIDQLHRIAEDEGPRLRRHGVASVGAGGRNAAWISHRQALRASPERGVPSALRHRSSRGFPSGYTYAPFRSCGASCSASGSQIVTFNQVGSGAGRSSVAVVVSSTIMLNATSALPARVCLDSGSEVILPVHAAARPFTG